LSINIMANREQAATRQSFDLELAHKLTKIEDAYASGKRKRPTLKRPTLNANRNIRNSKVVGFTVLWARKDNVD